MTEAEERTALLATLALMGGLAGYDLFQHANSATRWEVWVPTGGGFGELTYTASDGEVCRTRWGREDYEEKRDLTRAHEFPLCLLRKLMNHALGGSND